MIKNYFSVAKQYLSLKADNKRYFSELCASALLRDIIVLSFPLFLSLIVDSATKSDFYLSFLYLGGLAIVYIIYTLIYRWNYTSYTKNANYLYLKMQGRIINKISTLDENFTKTMSKSNLINTTSADITKLRSFPAEMVNAGCKFLSVILAIFLLFNVNIYVGIFALFFNIIYLTTFEKWRKRKNYYLYGQRKHQDNIIGLYDQVLSGNKEIKTFNIEDKLNRHMNMHKRNWTKAYFSKRFYLDKMFGLIHAVLGIAKYIIYIIFILEIAEGKASVAELVLIIGYFESLENQNSNLTSLYNNFSTSEVRIKRISKILNYTNKNILEFGDNDNDYITGVIDFDHVSFNYENKPVLKDVSFHIESNSLTAIVGKSGSGKSTIFRLLLRLYKLDKGKIFIDGVDIYDYSKGVYASNVSIATQKPFIFNMSIKENLNLVDSNHQNQIEACKRVGIHDFIMSLPKGYNTLLKEDATDISGGQKQLIALARTLLSKSEILLFDEVTSSLDPNTAKQVIKVLKDLKKDHTVLMITHKPKMMKLASKVIVIDKGKVVGDGTNKSLQNNKYYMNLQK